MAEAKALLQDPVQALPKLGEEQLKAGQGPRKEERSEMLTAKHYRTRIPPIFL